MKKIDVHLHLTLNQYPKNDKMFISSAENMIPHLDKLNIEKGILMSSGEKNNPMMPIGHNEECRQICEIFNDKFVWMCNLDYDDEDSIYERLSLYKEQGAVGIGEFMINRKLNDTFIEKVFEAAEKLDLPILFHMSPEEGYQYGIVDDSGLLMLEEALKKYPKLKFIGHSQPFWHEISKNPGDSIEERMAWGSGKVTLGGRLPYLFENYPNLYGDLSANSGGCAIMRDEEFGLTFLERFKDRLLFGTDMVNNEMEFPLGKWLDERYEEGSLDKETYENICNKNAVKLFNL